MSPIYLSRIERGLMSLDWRPSDRLLKRTAEVLELPADELYRLGGRVPPDVVKVLVSRPGLFERARAFGRTAPPKRRSAGTPARTPARGTSKSARRGAGSVESVRGK